MDVNTLLVILTGAYVSVSTAAMGWIMANLYKLRQEFTTEHTTARLTLADHSNRLGRIENTVDERSDMIIRTEEQLKSHQVRITALEAKKAGGK